MRWFLLISPMMPGQIVFPKAAGPSSAYQAGMISTTAAAPIQTAAPVERMTGMRAKFGWSPECGVGDQQDDSDDHHQKDDHQNFGADEELEDGEERQQEAGGYRAPRCRISSSSRQ